MSIPKTCSKKVGPRISGTIDKPGDPLGTNPVCAFFKHETIVRATIEALFEKSLETLVEFEMLTLVRTTIEAVFENLAGKVS